MDRIGDGNGSLSAAPRDTIRRHTGSLSSPHRRRLLPPPVPTLPPSWPRQHPARRRSIFWASPSAAPEPVQRRAGLVDKPGLLSLMTDGVDRACPPGKGKPRPLASPAASTSQDLNRRQVLCSAPLSFSSPPLHSFALLLLPLLPLLHSLCYRASSPIAALSRVGPVLIVAHAPLWNHRAAEPRRLQRDLATARRAVRTIASGRTQTLSGAARPYPAPGRRNAFLYRPASAVPSELPAVALREILR